MTLATSLSQLQFPVQFLEVVESFLRSRGVSGPRLCQACGLPEDHARTSGWIDGNHLHTILDMALAHSLPNEPASLQILRHLPLTAVGTLGMFTITSGTVGEALEAVLRYHSLVMPLISMQRLVDTSDAVRIRLDPTLDFTPHNGLLAELFVGVLKKLTAYTTVKDQTSTVAFSHGSTWPLEVYASDLGTQVSFGAPANVITIPHRMLQERLTTGNQATNKSLEPLLRRDAPGNPSWRALTPRVRQHLTAGLQEGKQLQSEGLAHELAMSARTLSRRLHEEGTSLKLLTEQVRMEYAEQLLSGTAMTIHEIAKRAGYADPSCFTRAYKRAMGNTPAAQRKLMMQKAVSG